MFHRDRDSPSSSCRERGRTRSLPPRSTWQNKDLKPGQAGSVSLQRLLPTYCTGASCSPRNERYHCSSLLPSSLCQLTQRCPSEFPNSFIFQPRDLSLLHRANSSAAPFSESSHTACEHFEVNTQQAEPSTLLFQPFRLFLPSSPSRASVLWQPSNTIHRLAKARAGTMPE